MIATFVSVLRSPQMCVGSCISKYNLIETQLNYILARYDQMPIKWRVERSVDKTLQRNARQRRKFEYARSDISKAIINLNNAALSSNNSKSGAKENKRSKRNSVNQLIK